MTQSPPNPTILRPPIPTDNPSIWIVRWTRRGEPDACFEWINVGWTNMGLDGEREGGAFFELHGRLRVITWVLDYDDLDGFGLATRKHGGADVPEAELSAWLAGEDKP